MPVPGGTQNIICGQAVTSRPGPGQLPASKKYIQGKRLQIFCKQRVFVVVPTSLSTKWG